MNNLLDITFIEFKKAWRSKMLFITLLAILFISIVGALFIVLIKHPEQAKNLGIINTKAQLIGATASWDFYLGFYSQAIGVGGMIIFSFIAAWVFGREYIDKKLKDLLALPTSRTTIVLAKFGLISVWALTFSWLALAVGIGLGFLIGLPGLSRELLIGGITRAVVASLLAVCLAWAVALVANITRSYFPAIGALVLIVALAQIATALGWGEYFPWAVVGMYANPENPIALGPPSYIIVVITGLLGVLGTVWWWRYADHSY